MGDALKKMAHNEQPHTLRVTIDKDGEVHVSIVCPYSGADRPCATFMESTTGCQCTDEACPCREDLHDECLHYEIYVDLIGPECQTTRINECWYEHAISEVGTEMLSVAPTITFEAKVLVSGSSFEDPIDVEAVEPE